MHKSFKISLALGVVLIPALSPSVASAHPCLGVCSPDSMAAGFAHPFGGLDHLLAMVAVGLWAVQLGGAALWALPLAFMSALVIGGGLAMFGVPFPLIEPGILGSVVVFGLAVALAWRVSLASGIALVAAFALFHGYAHGVEMPENASALSYAIGFVAATCLLHAIGVGTGLLSPHLNRQLTRGMGAAISVAGIGLFLL